MLHSSYSEDLSDETEYKWQCHHGMDVWMGGSWWHQNARLFTICIVYMEFPRNLDPAKVVSQIESLRCCDNLFLYQGLTTPGRNSSGATHTEVGKDAQRQPTAEQQRMRDFFTWVFLFPSLFSTVLLCCKFWESAPLSSLPCQGSLCHTLWDFGPFDWSSLVTTLFKKNPFLVSGSKMFIMRSTQHPNELGKACLRCDQQCHASIDHKTCNLLRLRGSSNDSIWVYPPTRSSRDCFHSCLSYLSTKNLSLRSVRLKAFQRHQAPYCTADVTALQSASWQGSESEFEYYMQTIILRCIYIYILCPASIRVLVNKFVTHCCPCRKQKTHGASIDLTPSTATASTSPNLHDSVRSVIKELADSDVFIDAIVQQLAKRQLLQWNSYWDLWLVQRIFEADFNNRLITSKFNQVGELCHQSYYKRFHATHWSCALWWDCLA